ncbi:MAG TPA: N,N-dimethylformamidase beta subunit family domain-containing protein [Candidatus Limnocylindrales bacterium]|nr:N,N-dimethylformamidase beta subunit family domain-containing protein [Candidatus Limnocylindrales bacterium]
MKLSAYAERVSCEPGDALRFHIIQVIPKGATVSVYDVPTERLMLSSRLEGPLWTLSVPRDWPSSLYRAAFSGCGEAEADGPDADVHFVVRALRPGSDAAILVSVPFTTWQAYNRAGEPGESIYYAEEPTRAAVVSFDRPGGGPPPERWEHGLMRWLPRAGYRVEYCANTDLHRGGDELLAAYRLLVVNGHDEYWSRPMRDAVERFAQRGGNIAFFGGNTCWWQIRLEDEERTMVCYRDAVADPMSSIDPGQVTVEWSSAPVNRPENFMTGVSFRRGAGTWGPYMKLMREESYRVRFADHWVFAGTGLATGDKFAHGALGYETDAAEFEEIDGVPRVTGRDGTPHSFVVLATADLRHWRRYGQGGEATMGVFRLGAGTVFNAATVNWGAALDDPVVDQITRNVLDRLSRPHRPRWEVIGGAEALVALGACEGIVFGVTADGVLCARECCGQNMAWRPIGEAAGVRALAVPREAAWGMPLGLYAVTGDDRISYRDPTWARAPWCDLAAAPRGTMAMSIVNAGIFTATSSGELWHLPLRLLAEGPVTWTNLGSAAGAVALAALGGRLFAIGRDGHVWTRRPVVEQADWVRLYDAGGAHTLTGWAGMLIAAGDQLRWRPARPR